jgi:hypothetical protein
MTSSPFSDCALEVVVRFLKALNVFVKALFSGSMLCDSKNAVDRTRKAIVRLRKLLNDTNAEKWRQHQVIGYEGHWVEVVG